MYSHRNAFYKSNGCCYHHGTLLVNVDKNQMAEYLNVLAAKLQSKGVDSVRSRTVNLTEFNENLEQIRTDIEELLKEQFSA